MKAVNLIPSDERSAASNLAGSSEGGAFIVLGLMAGLAILALLYGVAHHQISSRDGQAASLTAQANAARSEASQLAPYTSFVALRAEREQAVSQLVESRFDWAHAIHELGRVLPVDVALTSVHGSIAGVEATPPPAATTTTTTSTSTSTSSASTAPAAAAPTSTAVASATPTGSTPIFTIVGCAVSQAEVADTLNRLRLIDGVTDVTLQSSTKADASSSSGSSSGSCPKTDPTFTVQVTFDALPAAPSTGSSASGSAAASNTVTSTTATASATTAAATNGGS